MTTQRPLLPLLVILYQTAVEHPLGAQARAFEEALNKDAVNQGLAEIPRPTLVIALRQATLLGILRAEGEKRGRRYFAGLENPGLWNDEEVARRLQALGEQAAGEGDSGGAAKGGRRLRKAIQVHATPKVTSGQTKNKKAVVSTTPLSTHDQQFKRLQALVWGVADTLRDRSNLQVDGYRPITLLLLTLKRNLDTQTRLHDQRVQALMADEEQVALMDAGVVTGADFAKKINEKTEIFDPAIFTAGHPHYDKACAALMQWNDLLTFPVTNQARRETPITLRLAANPSGKSWFTYTTHAGNQQSLIEELVSLHVADLREAFSAIGLHAALVPADPSAPRLSSKILGELVENLAQVDLSPEAIPGDVFSDAYMDLLARFAEGSGKKGGDFFTPLPLVQGLVRLFPIEAIARDLAEHPNKQIRVADPTAGAFTFLTAFWEALQDASAKQGLPPIDRRQVSFYAQELTSIQAGLGIFNFFHHGLASRLALYDAKEEANGRSLSSGGAVARVVGDTISEYMPKIGRMAGRMDYILTNPPYGTADYGIGYTRAPAKGDQRWQVGAPTRSEGEWAFINTVVDLLSPTGKAGIVLPLGVLFRDGGKAFRQYLVEKNWLEGIVALPSNQFLTTQIPVCMLVLNKDTQHNFLGQKRGAEVFFINASDDFTKTGKFNLWEQDPAFQAWWARTQAPGYSGFVSAEMLRSARNDYSLAVNRYFSPIKAQVIQDPVALSDHAATLRERLAQRTAWFDGTGGDGGGLWQQAVLAHAAGGLLDGDDAMAEKSQPGESA